MRQPTQSATTQVSSLDVEILELYADLGQTVQKSGLDEKCQDFLNP